MQQLKQQDVRPQIIHSSDSLGSIEHTCDARMSLADVHKLGALRARSKHLLLRSWLVGRNPQRHTCTPLQGSTDLRCHPLLCFPALHSTTTAHLQRPTAEHRPLQPPIPPHAGLYNPDFIAANQEDRADNIIGGTPTEQLAVLRQQMRDFKARSGVDSVVVLWTANTERYSEIIPGVNDTQEALLQAIKDDHFEVSPSTIFAVAAILENVPYINGAPQNTFVPGCIQLAESRKSFIGGDDFKSGQVRPARAVPEQLLNPLARRPRSSPSSPTS